MAHPGDGPQGLRERKKRRTRATLIDVAVRLCLEQGYQQTTVDQIAAAADVSPRTFSRYFPTKESVFLTLVEDFVDQVAVELALVPADVGPLEALRQAHVTTFSKAANSPDGTLSDARVMLMVRIVNSSTSLRQRSLEFRDTPALKALANRMGVEVGDRRLMLVAAVFMAIVVAASDGLLAGVDDPHPISDAIVERLNATFEEFALVTADRIGDS